MPRPDKGEEFFWRGKFVGRFFKRTKVFLKEVKPEHLFRKHDAWGIDAGVLHALSEKRCQTVRLFCREEGVVYNAPLKAFTNEGISGDFGYGVQVFLPRSRFATQRVP